MALNHIFNADGKKLSMNALLSGPDSAIWSTALSNELGRLTQGIGDHVVSTDTINFIMKQELPKGKKVTYANFICDHRLLKEEEWRVHLIVGGNRLDYNFDAGSPAASILETELTINSVIYDAHKGACFMGSDHNFFSLLPYARLCKTLRGVLTSAAETETGGVFHHDQTAVFLKRALEVLGHPQPPISLRNDNSVANSSVHSNIKQRRSKT